MNNNELVIREMTTEDLHAVRNLLVQTASRFVWDPRYIVMSVEELGEEYINVSDSIGYVAELGEEIAGFMGVSTSDSGNGYIRYGVDEQSINTLPELLDTCEQYMRFKGGSELSYFAITQFGQIRNKEISLFEQLGFQPDEFASTTTLLYLLNWQEPEHLDTVNIIPITGAEIDLLEQLLLSDGDNRTKLKWDSTRVSETIALALQSPTGEIQGFAHYKVHVGQSVKTAVGFGIHYRPQFELPMTEKRRLLRAALVSMKQLGITHVSSHMTLNDFQKFVLLASEGFDEFITNGLRLTKEI